MRIKKFAAIFLIGIFLITQSMPVLAQTSLTASSEMETGILMIAPRWTNTDEVTLTLYFENGNACCTGDIVGITGVKNITATFTLERKTLFGWSLEESWNASSSSKSLSFFQTKAVSKGTYRLTVNGYVTKDGYSEPISVNVEGTN